MRVDLKNEENRQRLEAIIMKNISSCKSIVNINVLTGGASRQMFKVHMDTEEGDKIAVLRLPGNEGEESLDQLSLSQEVVVMEAVLAAGVKTPKIYFELQEEDGLGEGYMMEFLAGETLGGRIARSRKYEEARNGLATQVGTTLGKIHRIETSGSALAEELPKLTPSYVVHGMYSAYESSGVHVPMIEYTYKWLMDHLPEDVESVLSHGDFRNGNLIVDPVEGLVGILDWEFGALCDPMKDLAYFCLMPWRYGVGHLEAGGFGSKEDFFRAYEKESGIKVDETRFKWWQVYSCFWWTIACIMMGMSYRTHENKLGDRIAIGRRHTEGLIDLVDLLIPGPITVKRETSVHVDKHVASLRELVGSTLKDMKNVVSPDLEGRALFMARVGMSNLAIAIREIESGGIRDQIELSSCNALLQENYLDVFTCRQMLCQAIKSGDLSVERKDLEKHLRNSIASQIAIDQPQYSGLQKVMSYA